MSSMSSTLPKLQWQWQWQRQTFHLFFCIHTIFAANNLNPDTQLCLAIKGFYNWRSGGHKQLAPVETQLELHGQGQFLLQLHSCGCQKFANCVKNINFLHQISDHRTTTSIILFCPISYIPDPLLTDLHQPTLTNCDKVKTDSFTSAQTNTKGRSGGENDVCVHILHPDFFHLCIF